MTLQAAERFTKWRKVFAAWQLGVSTMNLRKGEHPTVDAVRDQAEVTMLMRAELNALVALLVRRGVFTQAEFSQQLDEEMEHLSGVYQKRFPGFRAADDGLDINIALAQDTMKGWLP